MPLLDNFHFMLQFMKGQLVLGLLKPNYSFLANFYGHNN